MKAQVALEALMLFAITLIMVSFVTQALLQSYGSAQKQSSAVRDRALVENDIFTNELLCNSDIKLPSQIRKQGVATRIKIEEWVIKLVGADMGAEQEFSGVFVGCGEDAVFV